MAFGNTIIHARVVSMILESITSVRIKYVVSVLDTTNTAYSLQTLNEDSFMILLTLTPGNPIPGVQDIVNVIENEMETKFNGIADSVEVDGIAYPYPPPTS